REGLRWNSTGSPSCHRTCTGVGCPDPNRFNGPIAHPRSPAYAPSHRQVRRTRWRGASPTPPTGATRSNTCSIGLRGAAPRPPRQVRGATGAGAAGRWGGGRVTRAAARQLVRFGPDALADRLTGAPHVYVSAMGYPPGTARPRRTLWLEHVRRPG